MMIGTLILAGAADETFLRAPEITRCATTRTSAPDVSKPDRDIRQEATGVEFTQFQEWDLQRLKPIMEAR